MPPIPRDPNGGPQQQQQQQAQRRDGGGPGTSPRQWLKFILVIFSGFLLGVILGMLSTSLVFYFVPAPWLEHALKHRKAKIQEHVELRRLCRSGDGFIERYDSVENVVQICACWPKGLSEMGGWFVSCTRVGLMGYLEEGSWASAAAGGRIT